MIYVSISRIPLLLFDDNKIKIIKKPGKKQKENPVGGTREGKKMKRKYKRRVKRR